MKLDTGDWLCIGIILFFIRLDINQRQERQHEHEIQMIELQIKQGITK